jgi:hypothetical protein
LEGHVKRNRAIRLTSPVAVCRVIFLIPSISIVVYLMKVGHMCTHKVQYIRNLDKQRLFSCERCVKIGTVSLRQWKVNVLECWCNEGRRTTSQYGDNVLKSFLNAVK